MFVSIAVITLGVILILFRLFGVKLNFIGELHTLGKIAQTMILVVGLCLITLGWWLHPTSTIAGNIDEEMTVQPVQNISTKAGTIFRDCIDCPEMIVLPKGQFLMGAPENEALRHAVETPQHKVTINYVLAVARTELTFAEWDACASAGACRKNVETNWPRGQQPVININWNDTEIYLTWLNKTTGQNYRLLSEAEWEYAARANSKTAYFWGNEIGSNHANCTECGEQSKNIEPQLAGSYLPNPFGLFDLHGNVQEWVQDCWHNNYQGAPQDGSAWLNSCSEAHRVLRGGAWSSSRDELRSAARDRKTWDHTSPDTGFRIARVIAEPTALP